MCISLFKILRNTCIIIIMKKLDSLLENLNNTQLEQLSAVTQSKTFINDEVLLEKGKKNDLVYILKSGQAYVLDKDPYTPSDYLAEIKAGESFGGASAFLKKETISDVQIKKGSIVEIIDIKELNKNDELYHELRKSISNEFVNNMSKLNYSLLEKLSQEIKYSLFLQVLLISLSLGIIFSSYSMTTNMDTNLLWIWVYFIFLLPGPCFYVVKINEPFSRYGVSLQGFTKNLVGGVGVSIISVIALSLLAILVQPYTNIGISDTLLYFNSWWVFLIYFAHSYLQEFIARGLLQTTIQDVVQKKKNTYSIIVASLVFSATHIAYGFYTVVLVFIIGIFFGYLYTRFKNLLGVAIVHAITGEFFFMYLHALQASQQLTVNLP